MFFWRRQWHPTPVLCLENPMDGGAWWAAVHGVAKSRIRLSNLTFTFHFHALEKEMATHSSVLAWRIPGTGETGGCRLWGSHRVGHNWSDLAAAYMSSSTSILKARILSLPKKIVELFSLKRQPTLLTFEKKSMKYPGMNNCSLSTILSSKNVPWIMWLVYLATQTIPMSFFSRQPLYSDMQKCLMHTYHFITWPT